MIKAVIFDLDDTLISEMDYIKSGYKHIAHILSGEFHQNEQDIYNLLMKFFNEDSTNVFNKTYDHYSFPYTQKNIENLVYEYRNHNPDITVFDDVIPTLKKLKEKGYSIGMITDGYKEAQRKKIEAINIEHYFEHIIVTDEIGREYWKPNPIPFAKCCEELKVDFIDALYIGDNPNKDFHIKSLHPIKTARIIRNNNIYLLDKYKDNIKPDFYIKSLFDIFKIVEGKWK